ncbi:MAG: 4-(cytidine 5'-diphospho)-2-C-methyl-D-erythritol kinase [bacterium]
MNGVKPRTARLRAPAKVNLSLTVLGRRPDGFHDVSSVMVPVSLSDDVTVRAGGKPGTRLVASGFAPTVREGDNLAVRAALLLLSKAAPAADVGVKIALRKRIPVGAGLGGGSSDAAAVLKGLNALLGKPLDETQLMETALEAGSDAPFFLAGSPCLVEGRGERLTPFRIRGALRLVILKPAAGVSTEAAYNALDGRPCRECRASDGVRLVEALKRGDLEETCRRLHNCFEAMVAESHPSVKTAKELLIGHGAAGAAMTGTGSAVFGVYADRRAASAAAAALKRAHVPFEVFAARTL